MSKEAWEAARITLFLTGGIVSLGGILAIPLPEVRVGGVVMICAGAFLAGVAALVTLRRRFKVKQSDITTRQKVEVTLVSEDARRTISVRDLVTYVETLQREEFDPDDRVEVTFGYERVDLKATR